MPIVIPLFVTYSIRFRFTYKTFLVFVGYPSMLASGVMKRQIQLPSLPWICLVPRLVYPTLILNI